MNFGSTRQFEVFYLTGRCLSLCDRRKAVCLQLLPDALCGVKQAENTHAAHSHQRAHDQVHSLRRNVHRPRETSSALCFRTQRCLGRRWIQGSRTYEGLLFIYFLVTSGKKNHPFKSILEMLKKLILTLQVFKIILHISDYTIIFWANASPLMFMLCLCC